MLFSRHEMRLLCNIPENWYWLCTLVFILFCCYFFFRCYRAILKARHIEDTPTSKIRSATQGYVELNGVQVPCPEEKVQAFLTHKPCTWYRYTIEFWSDKRWQVIESGQSSNLFAIDDGTGVCYVDPMGAEITAPECIKWQGSRRYPTQEPRSFFAKLFSGGGSYRYCEWRMSEGSPIYAAGNFLTLNKSMIETPTKTKQVSQLVKNWDKNHKQFLVLLFSGGFLALGAPAQRPPHKPQKAKAHLSPTINVLSNYGLDKRHPFIISGHGERKLINSYKFDAFIWGFSFIALFTFTAFIVHFRFSC